MARSSSRSARRNRGAPPAPKAGRNGSGAAPTWADSTPRPAKAGPAPGARVAPARSRARGGGVDARWLIAGATAAVVVAAIAISLFAGGFFGAGGGSGSAAVGRVSETAVGGPAATGQLATGTPAPDLQWTLDGQSGSIAGERGHPVLLAFVATWCPHCQAEVAVLNKVQDRFRPQGLRVLGVTASSNGMDGRSPASLGDTELFVQRHKAAYPHLFDQNLVGAQRYGVRSFPSLYLIDSAGTIRYAQSGEVPESELAAQVQAVLNAAPGAAGTATGR